MQSSVINKESIFKNLTGFLRVLRGGK